MNVGKAEKLPLDVEKQTENLKIPLVNGNVMNIPFSAINISEEVDNTGIWKNVNKKQYHEVKDKKKSPKTKNRFKKKKQSKKDEVKREEQLLEKRLSTCKEEDDEGITIKTG